ncbi:hypothetical protein A3L11_09975 [Thermococcus siculi]|uniref:Uncharacterized protein n=1 Tax=Thermococcus siculi TaxID=72803 RepID=A0A2Z2MQA1_9EURY|nr:hypothetical protein [Thermococcus siculi]ASJ09541.1 hypothetical protein A3L11_09975 [Thermococcus siculi]
MSGKIDARGEGHPNEIEELEEALTIADHIHNIFVMALVVSTIISGIVWIPERLLHGSEVAVPLEIQAMFIFLTAFMITFYLSNVRKLRPIFTIFGAVLLIGAIGVLYTLLTGLESIEETMLILASFLLGISGQVLYSNKKLMERIDWLLMLSLMVVLAAVLVVFLLTL